MTFWKVSFVNFGLNPEILACRLHTFRPDCAEISRRSRYFVLYVQQNIVPIKLYITSVMLHKIVTQSRKH